MISKAAELEARGRQALEEGDYRLAESLFLQALAEDDDPSIRNNLALANYLMGKPVQALEKLDDGLSGNIANPFGRALAAQCLVALGRMQEAKRMVVEAVGDFEEGLRIMKSERVAIPESWREYTVMIMRSAGAVRDHRQVLEIYRRWQQLHVTCECRYLAGIAAFNLRRFRQAASFWAGLEQEHFNTQLQLVGVMADKGLIPPFALEYDWFHKAGLACYRGAKTEEALRTAITKSGLLRLFLLIIAVGEPADENMNKTALEAIVLHGGGWGQGVGLAFLQSPLVDDKLKVTAAEALVKAGVFAEGEDIPLFINGRLQAMKVSQVQVTWEAPEEILASYRQALSLREQGKAKEAILLLEAQSKGPVIYPPAMLVLANLYRTEKVYLLKRGGWARMSAVVRRFGSMQKDGFLMNEPPQSAAGKLWLKGLIFVGRVKIKNRNVKIATVAVELRQALAELLSV
ncbi:MAG: hypothetical protein KGZ79_07665 [Dethiobacter sp.]|jgi:tetratricopeptide (TPR) repeat protein|nr:hypothetical protein [Dethiobacter sp.]